MDVLCLMKCVLKISFKFLHCAFCIYIKNFRIIPVPIYSVSFSYIRLVIVIINIGLLVICIGILFSHDAFCLWILLFEYRIADLTTVGFIWFDAAFTAGSPPQSSTCICQWKLGSGRLGKCFKGEEYGAIVWWCSRILFLLPTYLVCPIILLHFII